MMNHTEQTNPCRSNRLKFMNRKSAYFSATLLSAAMLLSACAEDSAQNQNKAAPDTVNTAPKAVVKATGVSVSSTPSAEIAATIGDRVLLDASTSLDADQDRLTFEWRVDQKPTSSKLVLSASQRSSAILDFSPDSIGTYTFTLLVSDGRGAIVSKKINLETYNTAPDLTYNQRIVFTGLETTPPPQNVTVASNILLDARSSTDPENSKLRYVWEVIQKPINSNIGLSDNDLPQAFFYADVIGTFIIKTTAIDESGAFSSVISTFNVNNHSPEPLVMIDMAPSGSSAGAGNLEVALGNTALLDASNSMDVEGSVLKFEWRILKTPNNSNLKIEETTLSKITVTPDVFGEYVVELKAIDSFGASNTYTQTIVVNNKAPSAVVEFNAKPVISVTAPATILPKDTLILLKGHDSYDPEGGQITYLWSTVSVPSASLTKISKHNDSNVSFAADQTGLYVFRLRVTDQQGEYSEKDIVMYAE